MTAKNIKIHLPFGNVSAIGPGKADLLEAIKTSGSISAAARCLGMSYKRAWDLVDTMNCCFIKPVVITSTGGSHGGGAQVTEFGTEILRAYREIEVKANSAVSAEIAGLQLLLSPVPGK